MLVRRSSFRPQVELLLSRIVPSANSVASGLAPGDGSGELPDGFVELSETPGAPDMGPGTAFASGIDEALHTLGGQNSDDDEVNDPLEPRVPDDDEYTVAIPVLPVPVNP